MVKDGNEDKFELACLSNHAWSYVPVMELCELRFLPQFGLLVQRSR